MRVLYLGDIHGNYKAIKNHIEKFDITDAYIIQVGDFGVGFTRFDKEKRELEMFNIGFAKRNVIILAIRGNHDFKPYFDNDPFNLSNIKLIKDYTVMNLNGLNHLFVGGAVSIDRLGRYTSRQKIGDFNTYGNESWWKDEVFTYDEELTKTFKNIDVVITHSCPSFAYPDNSNGFGPFVDEFIYYDPKLKEDLTTERKLLTQFITTLKSNNDIKFVYYGHYHKKHKEEIDGTVYHLLDINELHEERS